MYRFLYILITRNPKGDGNKKDGLKVHMLTDVHADTAKFVKMSEATYDKHFFKHLVLPKGSMCDRFRQGIQSLFTVFMKYRRLNNNEIKRQTVFSRSVVK